MALCVLSTENDSGGYTNVDNAFIKEWLPSAPVTALKVYLLGLCFAGKNDAINNIEQMCRILLVTEQDVLDAYLYWEECGLVFIGSTNPLRVEYIGAGSRNVAKKVSAGKYKDFNKKMQKALSGRMISVNEFNEYYSFLENSFFEPDALVEIAKYCVEMKGDDIGYAYILKIARDWDKAGIKNAEKIKEKISTQNFYNESLGAVMAALGVKRKIDIDDRRLYQKWTEEYGFDGDVVEEIAKRCKKQGMTKLDALLTEYYKLRLFSVKEIDDYSVVKEQNRQLARDVNRALGLYYADTTQEVETYIAPWLAVGFSAETILLVAKFCFRCRIQTLEGMDAKIKLFAERGCISEQAIIAYTDDVLRADGRIAQVLDVLELNRNVCAADRKNFKLWTGWGMPFEVVLFAAELCVGEFNPMAALNKTLADYKQNGVFDVEKAKAFNLTTATDTKPKENGNKNPFLLATDREYTSEQLQALFDDLTED